MTDAQLAELATLSPNELRTFGVLIILAEHGIITAETASEDWGGVFDDIAEMLDDSDYGIVIETE